MDWYQSSLSQEIQGHGMEILSVSQVSAIIGGVLDDPRLQDVWVRGEISNFKVHGSGHLYFSLGDKDGQKSAVISCVMWRRDAQQLQFSPHDGMDVLVFGSVGHYAPHGRYQFYVRDIRHAGLGEKHLLVERWKKELSSEGCFALERKRPLPPYPARVGVVTSETGAVLQDIRNVIARRYPVELVVAPTAVQGESAHLEIARALQRIDGMVDVIVIARGGGSFEDLFPFNRPEVVRAIICCSVPVVSAVGHEVDITLADFAADVRAPTPSAAAEVVVPDQAALRESLAETSRKLRTSLLARLDRAGTDLAGLRERFSPRRMERRFNERREALAEITGRLQRGLGSCLALERERLRRAREVLDARNPVQLLKRGYCLLSKDGKIVRSSWQIGRGDRLEVRMGDGKLQVNVEGVRHDQEV